MGTRGVYQINGSVQLTSPLLIGCGSSEHSDIDLLLDGNGKPYIPGTSLAGVLRSSFVPATGEKEYDNYWGFGRDAGRQSRIVCDDMTVQQGSKFKIVIRDGIKLDPQTALVEDQKKYDYQVLEPGARFVLNLELYWHDQSEKATAAALARHIVDGFHAGTISCGAKTANGLGLLQSGDLTAAEFDFGNGADSARWLLGKTGRQAQLPAAAPLKSSGSRLQISAKFSLPGALIVRSYPGDPKGADAVQLQSNGRYVVPGSSLKGAVRTRARQILYTVLGEEQGRQFEEQLFGYVDEQTGAENDPRPVARKSRMRVRETVLAKEQFQEVMQHRVRIDRFTGGVIDGALFDSMPLYGSGNKQNELQLELEIAGCSEAEAGLLLLVLKDLWTGDLPLGGEKAVGRGVLHGKEAAIRLGEQQWKLTGEAVEVAEGDRAALSATVAALQKVKGVA